MLYLIGLTGTLLLSVNVVFINYKAKAKQIIVIFIV